MFKIAGFFTKRKKELILLFLCGLCITLIIFSDTEIVSAPQRVGLAFVSFFQNIVNGFVNWVNDTINSINEVDKLKKELAKTQAELLEYKKASHDNVILREKYELLSRELELAKTLDYSYQAAEIIGWGSQTDFSTFVINKGLRDGIKKGMPVVAFSGGTMGLVGKTISVTYNSSVVRTILDPNLKVSVMFKDNRFKGILGGCGPRAGFLEMDLVNKNALNELAAGAIVVTSGLGHLFPKDIPVGRWKEKYFAKDYEPVVKLQIEPILDFQRLEYVYLLKTGE